MANTILQVRRSNTSASPGTTLFAGELAYSYNTTVQALFLGSNSGVGTAANLVGGVKYNWLHQANTGTPGAVAANATVILDGNSFVYNVFSQGIILGTTVSGPAGNNTMAFVNSISNTGNSSQIGANTSGGGIGTELVTSAAISAYVLAKTSGSSVAGANTQIQFNNSAAFGGDADFTFDVATNIVHLGNTTTGMFDVGNSTVNSTSNQTQLIIQSSVTVNSTITSTQMFVANATTNTVISLAGIRIGNTIANTFANSIVISVTNATANSILTPVSLFLGNSIANSFSNSITTILANATTNSVMTPINLSIGNSIAYSNATQISFGVVNATSNIAMIPTSITIANSTANSILTSVSIFLGNSIANAFINSASLTVINATGSAILTPVTLAVGNSTINVNFTGGTLDVRATNTNITSNVTITGANLDATSAFLKIQQAQISGNLLVQGNLSVTGTLTSIDSTNIVVQDPVIIVNDGGITTDTADVGLVGYFGNSTVTQVGGLVRKNGGAAAGYANTFMLFTSQTAFTNTTTTVPIDANLMLGTLQSWIYSSANSTTTGKLVSNTTGLTATANSTWAVELTANTLSLSTPLPVTSGGIGVASVALGAVLLGNTTSAMVASTIGANGTIFQILNSAGATSQAVSGFAGIDGGTF